MCIRDSGNGEQQIDGIERLGCIAHLRSYFVERRSWRFRYRDILAAYPQRGHQRNGEDEDTHPSYPVSEGTPEENPLGEKLRLSQYSSSGSSEARTRFKKRVGKMRDTVGDDKWNSTQRG